MARPLKTKEELKKETEEAFLKEFGITKEAAEKSAAGEKRYIAPRDAAKQKISDSVAEKAGVSDDVFEKIEKDLFENRKKAEESERKFVEEFGKEFNRILKDSSDYVTEKQAKGKIVSPQKGYGSRDEWYQQSDDDFAARYDAAEEYVMSEGKNAFENTVKGMFNRLRSAPGETVEDIAYFLNDTIPEDAPGKAMRGLRENAGNVVEKNMAGSIGDISTFQFGKAIENGANKNIVNAMDEVSKELGYNIFGLKFGNYIEPLGEGFDVYRSLREQGYSKDEAAEKTILTLGHSFGTEMLFDKGEKWLLNRFKIKNGRGTNGIVAKVESKPPVFGIKSTEDVKKVLDYLEYVKKDSTIKYESEDVRKWYVNTTSQIHKMVDSNLPIKEKAYEAFDLRNKIRTGARDIMKDVEKRKRLDIEHSNFTFDELIESKMKRKGLTREEAIQDIYETAPKTNKEVNAIWGIINEQ